jgi:hypothetical protein
MVEYLEIDEDSRLFLPQKKQLLFSRRNEVEEWEKEYKGYVKIVRIGEYKNQ